MVYTHFGLVKGATIPKHIISSVRERSALEVAKAELRASLESEAPFGGKASWLELLKPLAKRVLEDIMDVELSEFLQASKSERTAQRRGCRNGYREVTLKSSTLGRLELSVPRDRDGNFNSRLLEKCPRVERSMLIALAEGYTQGLSTRKVVAFLNRLGLGDMSKSQLSRMRKKMDASLALTVNRPLRGECYEYLMCDALYSKAHVDGVARASACYIVIGIDGEGRRRLLALEVGDEESTANWSQVFQGLKRRGLGPISTQACKKRWGANWARSRSSAACSTGCTTRGRGCRRSRRMPCWRS